MVNSFSGSIASTTANTRTEMRHDPTATPRASVREAPPGPTRHRCGTPERQAREATPLQIQKQGTVDATQPPVVAARPSSKSGGVELRGSGECRRPFDEIALQIDGPGLRYGLSNRRGVPTMESSPQVDVDGRRPRSLRSWRDPTSHANRRGIEDPFDGALDFRGDVRVLIIHLRCERRASSGFSSYVGVP